MTIKLEMLIGKTTQSKKKKLQSASFRRDLAERQLRNLLKLSEK